MLNAMEAQLVMIRWYNISCSSRPGQLHAALRHHCSVPAVAVGFQAPLADEQRYYANTSNVAIYCFNHNDGTANSGELNRGGSRHRREPEDGRRGMPSVECGQLKVPLCQPAYSRAQWDDACGVKGRMRLRWSPP